MEPSSTPPRSRELLLVGGLTLLAAVRIVLSAAALPYFVNVDEPEHYDAIRKYATGYLPGLGSDRFDRDAAEQIALYETPEYMGMREDFLRGLPPPVWAMSGAEREHWFEKDTEVFLSQVNFEVYSPPVYYVLAALWHLLGRAVGLSGGHLLYWLRALNGLVYPALVALSYFFIRRFYPGERRLRLAVPLLVAVFPQDVFFQLNSDVISPLLFAISLYVLLDWLGRERPERKSGIAAGLAPALTFLVKYSNLAVLLDLAIVLGRRFRRDARASAKRRGGTLFWPVAAVCVPIVGWLGRNYVVLGDLTGTARKVTHLGWTVKPLAELGDHPFFTLPGFRWFWERLIANYWQGEIVWWRERLSWEATDWFFVLVTVTFLTAATIRWAWSWRRKPSLDTPDGLFVATIGLSVAFLIFLSLIYDFHDCFSPSRYRPYFVAGRLIIGTLMPFLILLVRGIEFTFSRWAPRVGPAVTIAAITIVSLIAPLRLLVTAASSPFNWFHLGSG